MQFVYHRVGNGFECYVCGGDDEDVPTFETGLPAPYDWLCASCLAEAINNGTLIIGGADDVTLAGHAVCDDCGEEFDSSESGMARCATHNEWPTCVDCGDMIEAGKNTGYCLPCGNHDECSPSCIECGNLVSRCEQHIECDACGRFAEVRRCVEHNISSCDRCGEEIPGDEVVCDDCRQPATAGAANEFVAEALPYTDDGLTIDGIEVRW